MFDKQKRSKQLVDLARAYGCEAHQTTDKNQLVFGKGFYVAVVDDVAQPPPIPERFDAVVVRFGHEDTILLRLEQFIIQQAELEELRQRCGIMT